MTEGKVVRLDPVLVDELEAHAAAQGGELEEVVNGLVRLGLDTELGGSTTARLETLERRLADLTELMNIAGPAIVGTQRIITHWASKSRDVPVGEDALMAELVAVGNEEWALQAMRRGVLVPLPPESPAKKDEGSAPGAQASAPVQGR